MPDETGKSNLDDIIEGKYTLLVHYALTKGSKSQISKLNIHLGNKKLTIGDHEDLKQIFVETGALDYCRSKAIELMEKANSSLLSVKSSDWDVDALDYLLGINQYILERKN